MANVRNRRIVKIQFFALLRDFLIVLNGKVKRNKRKVCINNNNHLKRGFNDFFFEETLLNTGNPINIFFFYFNWIYLLIKSDNP